MENKKFEHQVIEKCSISKKNINTLKDKYCILLDCNGKKIEKIKFYKLEILKDLISGNGEIVKNALLESQKLMVGKMLGSILPKTFQIN